MVFVMKQIKDLPITQRPRERLLSFGPTNLTEIELIALILGNGTRQQSVMDIAYAIVKRHTVKDLATMSIFHLQDTTHISLGQAGKIIAAIELGQRVLPPHYGTVISTPQDVINQVVEIRTKNQEHMIGLYLDARNRLLDKQLLAIGKLNLAIIDPRDVFRPAISLPASYIILVHNHPSGKADPSHEDIQFTKKLKQVGDMLGVSILDHIIVTRDSFMSLNEMQLI